MKKHIKRKTDLAHGTCVLILMMIILIINCTKVTAKELDKPYLIKVNRVFNTITIYEKGEKGQYDKPVKAMVCSVGKSGTQTKLGTFKTKEKYRWKILKGDVWGQYSTRIVGGILFHSVYYYSNLNPATLATTQYNRLGSAASHGCIRLTVGDAKWIYDNCPSGTTVMIYDDKNSPGPLGKPKAIKLPSYVRWDPTDPSKNNPYREKKPVISGLKNFSVAWGKKPDLLKGVKAKSSVGLDITSKIVMQGKVNALWPGKYDITYKVSDDLGKSFKKKITVTVNESTEEPVFQGITDQVLGKDEVIDKETVLEGVKVSCSGITLNTEDIKVTINQKSDDVYKVTYFIRVGKKVSATKEATFSIDREAPVFTGISDRQLEAGQVPDGAYALKDVSVSDNYTDMDTEDINVKIEQNEDGSYQVTYEATDKLGNTAQQSVRFYY